MTRLPGDLDASREPNRVDHSEAEIDRAVMTARHLEERDLDEEQSEESRPR